MATDSNKTGSYTYIEGYTLSDEGSAELSYDEAKHFSSLVAQSSLKESFDGDFALVAEACEERAVIKIA